jgi:multisubunit Na+/H+ antiporter MnhE subunit
MAEKDKKSDIAQPVTETEKKQKFDWTSLNTLAVVSLAASISWVGALVGVITGHIALAQLKTSGENGKRLAQIGLGLGYFYLFGWIILGLLGVVIKALVFPELDGLQPMGPGFMHFDGPRGDR